MTTDALYDVIVIGSGAAGGWVAKEASEGGCNTLLLEAGRALDPDADFPLPKDESASRVGLVSRVRATVTGQHVQARCMSYKPITAHLFINDRMNPYTTGPGSRFNWYRARQTGGRLHLWGRNALRISDQDFKAAQFDGFGDCWPISYADLEPWYGRVEAFLGVRGAPAGIDNLPDGTYSEPHRLTGAEQALLKNMVELWPDRPATTCRVIHHMEDHRPPTLKAAEATRNFELRSGAVVSHIETDPESGRATGVVYVDDKTRQLVTVRARVVAVAASTIESVRILLNSNSPRHPEGLGNSSGNLGRYLTDHLTVIRAGTYPDIEGMGSDHDPYNFGEQSGIFVPSFRNRAENEGRGFLRGYSLLGSVGRMDPGWFFMAIGEVLPRPENRVEIDADTQDAWGIPVAKITMRYSENEREMVCDMQRTLDELSSTLGLPEDMLGKEGLVSKLAYKLAGPLVYTDDGALVPGSSIHEAGGACMGHDPTRHVLNADNQLFDAPNVYVTDSAAFTTNPFHNPGLTIMALSARAGSKIASDIREFRE